MMSVSVLSDQTSESIQITKNENKPKHTSLNDLIGALGPYQINIALFYFFAYILSTLNNLGYVFQAAKTNYQCIKPDDSSSKFSSERIENIERQCDSRCPKWSYNNSIGFDETIVSKFELVCDDEWLRSLSQSLYQLGYVISGLAIGYISDSYGRKQALKLSIFFELIGGILIIVSPSIHVYMLARLMLGFGDSGRGMSLYMLIIETVGSSRRSDVILGTSSGWVIGYLLLPLLAWLLKNYIFLQSIPTTIMAVMAVLWLSHIPESPRWLLTQKRFEQAKKIVRNACLRNKKLENNFDQRFGKVSSSLDESKTVDRFKFQKLWVQKKYRNVTFIMWILFFTIGFLYHGFSLNTDIIEGNFFINFALSGLIEIPSMAFNLIAMRRMGRRKFTICSMIGATFSYISMVMLILIDNKEQKQFLIVGLSMLGKMFVFSAYNCIYIHAGEIFPTTIRHLGVSSCSIWARLGSMTAPFVKDLNSKLSLPFTMVLFGSGSLIAMNLAIFLPETKDTELVDQID